MSPVKIRRVRARGLQVRPVGLLNVVGRVPSRVGDLLKMRAAGMSRLSIANAPKCVYNMTNSITALRI